MIAETFAFTETAAVAVPQRMLDLAGSVNFEVTPDLAGHFDFNVAPQDGLNETAPQKRRDDPVVMHDSERRSHHRVAPHWP